MVVVQRTSDFLNVYLLHATESRIDWWLFKSFGLNRLNSLFKVKCKSKGNSKKFASLGISVFVATKE